MKRRVLVLLALVALATSSVTSLRAEDPPADRVMTLYFHRTERCATCLKMGSYSEEAVKEGFEKQIKEGTVEFRYVDFQDQKNAKLTKAYKITGPALIVVQVAGGKVKKYTNLKDIWTKVREKPEFIAYVRENLEASLK
ncbi:MAG: nitrophenyl compound nitroreductase subunit ArsF family protein [Pirellulaceae bacterium]